MSQKIIYVCDACHSEFDLREGVQNRVTVNIAETDREFKDICTKCAEKVVSILQST